MQDDCVFCKIVKGEVPANKVYEDADFMAFLDISPLNKIKEKLLVDQFKNITDRYHANR